MFVIRKGDVFSVEIGVCTLVDTCTVSYFTHGDAACFVDYDVDAAHNVTVFVGAFVVNVVRRLVSLGVAVCVDYVIHDFGVVDEHRTGCKEHYRSKIRRIERHVCAGIHDFVTVDCVQCRK